MVSVPRGGTQVADRDIHIYVPGMVPPISSSTTGNYRRTVSMSYNIPAQTLDLTSHETCSWGPNNNSGNRSRAGSSRATSSRAITSSASSSESRSTDSTSSGTGTSTSYLDSPPSYSESCESGPSAIWSGGSYYTAPSSTQSSSTASHAQNHIPHVADKRYPKSRGSLIVLFSNGSGRYKEEKHLVKRLVEEHYNTIPMGIRFQFLSTHSNRPSDIRVRFNSKGNGSSSFFGRENDSIPYPQDTMCLDLHGLSADQKQALVLRFFGRALGLRPEQMHPESGIEWVWDYLRENFDQETIEEEYRPRGVDRRRTEPYDPYSIMHVVVYEEETRNLQNDTELNTVLSQGDWNQLMEMYPADVPTRPKKKAKSAWRQFQECLHGSRRGRA
ncbi:hypothetical protein PG993_007932 [Apiospora rasikravindrae]|uniref:Uncharacterized protein n=1 Tax=Apiospora rasikravindrae TaxID=990691 RepID=A0ABR1SYX3_9PEZI